MTPEELYKYDSKMRSGFTFDNGRFTISNTPETEYHMNKILDYKVDGRKRSHEK
jgi:hypothetical protein